MGKDSNSCKGLCSPEPGTTRLAFIDVDGVVYDYTCGEIKSKSVKSIIKCFFFLLSKIYSSNAK